MELQTYKDWCQIVGLDIKPHQLEGFEWCVSRENGDAEGLKGGIICDEMGLGKTILMLGCTMIKKVKRTLIVVPPALMNQWKKCIQLFLKHNVCVYHGSSVKNITLEEIKSKQIVLTTYGMIASRGTSYQSLLWKIRWDRLICDEAHHMRNPKTNVCRGAFRLMADIKWFVTGTPIQNSMTDIRVLFALLGKVIRGEKQLKEYILNYVLRRTKKNVGLVLPKHQKTTVIVNWESKVEENLAASIHAQLPLFDVTLGNVDEIIQYLEYDSPLPLFVRARQVCINPQLLNKCVEKMKSEGLVPVDFRMKRVPTMSKMSAVVKKVKSQPKEKKKIIFSYYRGEIDELKRRLVNDGYTVSVMDGRSKKREKLDACDPEKAPDILIAQIQSASEGLNLQHFSQVYFTSPHWNPAVEEQAIARAHRIGQKEQVDTFHFEMAPFTEGGMTIDNYCMDVQKRKRELMKLLD